MITSYKLGLLLACALIGVAGCGGGGDDGPPPVYTTQIFSDPVFDGDIEQTSPSTFTITQGMSATVQSVFAGIDPSAGTEFRSFLDFPLSGAGGVPGNAIIESAFLDIYVNSIQPLTGTIPLLIELVAFQPPTLIESDFDRTLQPPLASLKVSPPFDNSDVGTNASIDVTSLMLKAQELGLRDFQLRILEDLGPAIYVLLEINDSTASDRPNRGPLLTVTYY
jgi:hypothetical protein